MLHIEERRLLSPSILDCVQRRAFSSSKDRREMEGIVHHDDDALLVVLEISRIFRTLLLCSSRSIA